MAQNPLAPPPPSGNGGFDRWMYLLWRRLTQAGQILWSSIDFSGSNITDLVTRRHRDLQDLQGGTTDEYYHFTAAQHTDLTDGGDSTLHYHATDRNADNHVSGTTNKVFTATEQSKLAGIEAGAEVNNISDINATDLTDGGDTSLHSHAAFVGDSGSGGVKGMVPAPSAGDAGKYLKGDGTWGTVSGGGGTLSNVVSGDLEVAADTSYMVVGYLSVEATLTVNGNVGVY